VQEDISGYSMCVAQIQFNAVISKIGLKFDIAKYRNVRVPKRAELESRVQWHCLIVHPPTMLSSHQTQDTLGKQLLSPGLNLGTVAYHWAIGLLALM
jgi:hypothetical protein